MIKLVNNRVLGVTFFVGSIYLRRVGYGSRSFERPAAESASKRNSSWTSEMYIDQIYGN